VEIPDVNILCAADITVP